MKTRQIESRIYGVDFTFCFYLKMFIELLLTKMILNIFTLCHFKLTPSIFNLHSFEKINYSKALET